MLERSGCGLLLLLALSSAMSATASSSSGDPASRAGSAGSISPSPALPGSFERCHVTWVSSRECSGPLLASFPEDQDGSSCARKMADSSGRTALPSRLINLRSGAGSRNLRQSNFETKTDIATEDRATPNVCCLLRNPCSRAGWSAGTFVRDTLVPRAAGSVAAALHAVDWVSVRESQIVADRPGWLTDPRQQLSCSSGHLYQTSCSLRHSLVRL